MNWFLTGSIFILAGMLIIVSGMLYETHETYTEGEKVREGGVVMIGPIPIAFGSDVPSLEVVMVLATVLMVVPLHLCYFHGWSNTEGSFGSNYYEGARGVKSCEGMTFVEKAKIHTKYGLDTVLIKREGELRMILRNGIIIKRRRKMGGEKSNRFYAVVKDISNLLFQNGKHGEDGESHRGRDKRREG
ncbi:MAG: hypothetical protein MASP_01950 [Candidatus Methanolliviera sp. GoM_asphalt]|nr:MAG: hypothetical protein MASP_01950 [Candidatus Methanolliviera sp. GoM_asphalt]